MSKHPFPQDSEAVCGGSCEPDAAGVVPHRVACRAVSEHVPRSAKYFSCYHCGYNGFYVFKDGDQFCAVNNDFRNIQESPCGFGDTELAAMINHLDGVGVKSDDRCDIFRHSDVPKPKVGEVEIPTTTEEKKAEDLVKEMENRMVTPWNTELDYDKLGLVSLQPRVDSLIKKIRQSERHQYHLGKMEAYCHIMCTLAGKAGALFNDGHDKCAQEMRTQFQTVQHLLNQTKKEMEEEKGLTETRDRGKDIPM